MAGKKVQLFVFMDGDGDQSISNSMPVANEYGNLTVGEGANDFMMQICDDGLRVFGLKPLPDKKTIYRVDMEVGSVAVGEFEIKVDFKEFKPPVRRARKRKS